MFPFSTHAYFWMKGRCVAQYVPQCVTYFQPVARSYTDWAIIYKIIFAKYSFNRKTEPVFLGNNILL
jgi:hypothetical protein